MKKLIAIIFSVTMILGCFVATSCSKDDTMSGVYGHVRNDANGSCYNFINENTVVYYSNATLSYTAPSYIGKSWWSASKEGEIYTYTVEDNKVYIPMQGAKGTILTKVGDSLIQEVVGTEFKKDLRP